VSKPMFTVRSLIPAQSKTTVVYLLFIGVRVDVRTKRLQSVHQAEAAVRAAAGEGRPRQEVSSSLRVLALRGASTDNSDFQGHKLCTNDEDSVTSEDREWFLKNAPVSCSHGSLTGSR
jgi:hypothetical protein